MTRTFLGTVARDGQTGRIGVRKPDGGFIQLFGELVEFRSAFGPFQPIDIGKRVYRVDGVVQMENDEQLRRRLG